MAIFGLALRQQTRYYAAALEPPARRSSAYKVKCGEGLLRASSTSPQGVCLKSNRVFHIFHKPLVTGTVLLLSTGIASARTRPTQHRYPSQRKLSVVLSWKTSASAHLTLASAKRRSKTKKVRGQQAIEGERARQIQAALVREGYMKGEPSGVWDQSTKDAMMRYQADHGWQTKSLPDSRALIQLGLGPNHEDAGNGHAVPAKTEPIKASVLPQGQQ